MNQILKMLSLFQVGDFSKEVLQSLGVPYGGSSTGQRVGQVVAGNREPDSGISSARSTTTVPWSHNDHDLQLSPDGQRLGEGEEEEHRV